MAGGSVKRRIAEFYRRQQFRFQNPRQTFRIAIRGTKETKGLSVCFGTLCVVDLFGVFPIIALPAALISCGNFYLFFTRIKRPKNIPLSLWNEPSFTKLGN